MIERSEEGSRACSLRQNLNARLSERCHRQTVFAIGEIHSCLLLWRFVEHGFTRSPDCCICDTGPGSKIRHPCPSSSSRHFLRMSKDSTELDFRTEIQTVGHAFSWLVVAATPRLNIDVAMGGLCVSVLDLIFQDPRAGEY